jgi:Na+/H+ antiporter NhaB
MVMRYAMLAAVGAASIWALITASANGGQWLLVDAGQGGGQADIAFWLLAAVAILITLSLCRFVIFGLPSMFGSWYEQRKQWIYTLVGGALLYGVFYLM